MTARKTATPGFNLPATVTLLARWLLGGVFIYLGWNKALQPPEFLNAIRQYQLIEHPLLLNLIAAVLPWLEILCGVLLVAGLAVRGTALLTLGMLVGFSFMVLQRSLAVHASGIPFCAIRFDCGCGGGEVLVCGKLLENLLLVLLSCWVLVSRVDRWCVRHDWMRIQPESGS